VIHYWWLVKADTRRPIRYGLIVAGLLLARVLWARRGQIAVRRSPTPRARTAAGPIQAGD
jgi:DMSO/TMAO reductase YedYZ heme-binding membrane subunit